jgi:hypothetical protein
MKMSENETAYFIRRAVLKFTEGEEYSRAIIYWFTDDGKWARSRHLAHLFTQRGQAQLAVYNLPGIYKQDAFIEEIHGRVLSRIKKGMAKHKAKKLFRLPANTPANILADRFEEEGMLEEANLLRGKYDG